MRGPPPQERPQQDDVSHIRVPSAPGSVRAHPYMQPMSKAPHVQVRKPTGETHIPKAKSHENSEPPGVYRATQLSPAYQTPDEGIWDQTYLSKALQQMKDSEIAKLKFPPNSSKPLEYEKWVTLVSTTMKGLHPEIGNYWERAIAAAENRIITILRM